MLRLHHTTFGLLSLPYLILALAGCAIKFDQNSVDRPTDASTDEVQDADASTDADVTVDVPDDTMDEDLPGDMEDMDIPDMDALDMDTVFDSTDTLDTAAEDTVVDDLPGDDAITNPYYPVTMVTGNLATLIAADLAAEICTGSSTMPIPSSTRRSDWQRLVNDVLAATPNWGTVYARADTYNLDTFVARDPVHGDFVVLVDRSNCEGIYVFDLDATYDVVIQVPYHSTDTGALELGIRVFTENGTRALMIAGADRCMDPDTFLCDGFTMACTGSLEHARYSDAGYYPLLVFQAVHAGLQATYPSSVALQIQGMTDASGANLIVSDGTGFIDSGSVSILFESALKTRIPAYATTIISCNAPGSGYTSTCGATNVQARHSNGSSNLCATAASASSNRFVFMELSALMLNGTLFNQIVQSVGDVVPFI